MKTFVCLVVDAADRFDFDTVVIVFLEFNGVVSFRLIMAGRSRRRRFHGHTACQFFKVLVPNDRKIIISLWQYIPMMIKLNPR